MTNICTKVTVRKRPIKNGQVSLYLDYYPAVRHPKTGKPTRREYLGIYIYADPKDKFETEFNKTMLRIDLPEPPLEIPGVQLRLGVLPLIL